MKIACIFICLLCLAWSCRKETKNLILENREKETGLMEFVDTNSLRIIPLETNDSVLIGEVQQVIVRDSFMLVVNYERPKVVRMFSRDGNFIREIGKQGRGPGEYLFVGCVDINDNKKEILVHDDDNFRIMIYDYMGNYLRTIPTNMYGNSVALPNGLYLQENRMLQTDVADNAGLLLMNEEGKMVKTFQPRRKYKSPYPSFALWDMGGYFTRNTKDIYFIPREDDRIFRVLADGQEIEEVLCLGVRGEMVALDCGECDTRIRQFDPVEYLGVTDEGVFLAELKYNRNPVMVMGTLQGGVEKAGKLVSHIGESKNYFHPRTTWKDEFVSSVKGYLAARLYKQRFPDLTEESNPVIVFYKCRI